MLNRFSQVSMPIRRGILYDTIFHRKKHYKKMLHYPRFSIFFVEIFGVSNLNMTAYMIEQRFFNLREKCSSIKTQKGVQSRKALYAIFLRKVLKFTLVCGIINQQLKTLLFRRFRRYAVTTLLTTL